jgi:hypothetical protein
MKKLKQFRKIGILLGSFFVLAVVLSGCASKNSQSAEDRARRLPDFGQPEKQADISGIIKAVSGNEVTILKLEFPGNGQEVASSTNSNSNLEQKKASINLGGGQPVMGGGQRVMGADGRNQDANTEAVMLEKFKQMSTGEEVVTIPVGVQMLKPDSVSDQKQPQMVEANISDLIANKMVRVWLDESATDKKVVSFVVITR